MFLLCAKIKIIKQRKYESTELNSKFNVCIKGTIQLGTAGYIYAQRIGDFILVNVKLYNVTINSTYSWINVGYIDTSVWGADAKITEEAFGIAYFSGGGPAYGDAGGKTTIKCLAQSSGKVQLTTQTSKVVSGKIYVAQIFIPIK